MTQPRTVTLMIFSLVLSLIFSGTQGTMLHPSLMEQGSGMAVSQMSGSHDAHAGHKLSDAIASDLMGPLSHGMGEPQRADSMGYMSHTMSDPQSAEDCQLKCMLAMCISATAVITKAELNVPKTIAVLTAAFSARYTQSQPETPFRPPIAA